MDDNMDSWEKGENEEQFYWSRGNVDIIQIKVDLRQIFMVEWFGGRGGKGTPHYKGHYSSIEEAKNYENVRDWAEMAGNSKNAKDWKEAERQWQIRQRQDPHISEDFCDTCGKGLWLEEGDTYKTLAILNDRGELTGDETWVCISCAKHFESTKDPTYIKMREALDL